MTSEYGIVIAVTGSRRLSLTDDEVEAIVIAAVGTSDIYRLCNGGQRGIDASFRRWFNRRVRGHRSLRTFKADWNEFGRQAGPVRNQRMIDDGADVLIAIPDDESRGTWDCKARAEEAGMRVHLVEDYLTQPVL